MNKKLTIGIDFDETIVSAFSDGKVIADYNKKFAKNITEFDLKDYYFSDHDGFHDIYWEYYLANYGNFPLYDNAREIISDLKNQGHKLFIITSRPLAEKEKTLEQIFAIFWEDFFERIIFTEETGKDDKREIAEKLGCDIVIDDAAHHIKNYLENKNLQIIQFKKGWNAHLDWSDRIFVAENWKEIEAFIAKFAEEK